jgi:cytochrome c peroxidase
MKFATRFAFSCVAAAIAFGAARADGLREAVLRDAARDAGLIPPEETYSAQPDALVAVGKRLFESRLLSLDNDTACASCHLDQFGSADGLANAIGTEGEGIGNARVLNGGDIVPRNALPFWGRGGIGFNVFFWDGKVDGSSDVLVSQFGDEAPSPDPLVVAVHLPPAEIGEMVIDRNDTQKLQAEEVETANRLYELLADRIRTDEKLGPDLALARSINVDDLKFIDIAEAIASFIRFNFRVKNTTFHDFVFGTGKLSTEELKGGLLFYGPGGCAGCHNGPYFSDLEFHAIPFPQVGFGRNGFGVDYGRFNVTLDEADRYAFRTPPLYNVLKTSPYSHSGSIVDLRDAIRVHLDPLFYVDPQSMSPNDRTDFYERLRIWSTSPLNGVVINEDDLDAIVKFLGVLSYESSLQVEIVD